MECCSLAGSCFLVHFVYSPFCIIFSIPICASRAYTKRKKDVEALDGININSWLFDLIFLVLLSHSRTLFIGRSDTHTDVGLVSQYDAISLFIFALSLFWAILITYLLSLATISAGALRLITEPIKIGGGCVS